jgi:ribosomal protein S18 acetylase RimI-like enzyme
VLRVRRARPGDEAEVAGVHVRSWQAGYRGLLPDRDLDALRPEDRMGRYTFGPADPDGGGTGMPVTAVPVTSVAVEDGVICGFVTTGPCLEAEGADEGEVLALYVDPDAWGRGVGRRLLAEARGRLGDMGCTGAVLWVLVGNDRAQRLYRADGWRPDGLRRRVEVWAVAVDEIRYRRPLP